MRTVILVVAFVAACIGGSGSALAVPSLSWTLADLGNGNWQYNYTITNDLLDRAIDSFSVDFSYGLYEALQVDSLPAGWGGSYAAAPWYDNTSGPQNGAFYGFADSGQAIAPGTSLAGFGTSFYWSFYDPSASYDPPLASFDGLRAMDDQAFSYTTVPSDASPTAPVPEPATSLLVGIAVAGLAGCRRILRPRRD